MVSRLWLKIVAKGSLRNKQDRLERLIGLLRSADVWTSARLCRRLSTSPRTLMRDLAELRDLGYPIEADKGRGGGIRLSGRWGVDRLNLSDQEVISLLVSLAITESLRSPLMSSSVQAIRQKIAQSFPNQQRQVINRLRLRILTGEPASNEVRASYQEPNAAVIEPVTSSFFKQKGLSIRYCAESGAMTERAIEPQCLLLNWPVWYVLAWDSLRDDVRLFRIDRISKAQVIPRAFQLRNRDMMLTGLKDYFIEL